MTFGWTSQVKVFRVGGEQTPTLLSSPSHPRLAILSSVPSEPIVTVPVVPSPGVGVVPPAVAVSAASAASSSAVPPVSAGVAARRPPSLGPATVPRASIEPAVEPSVAAIVRPASNRARVAVPPAAAVPAAAAAAAAWFAASLTLDATGKVGKAARRARPIPGLGRVPVLAARVRIRAASTRDSPAPATPAGGAALVALAPGREVHEAALRAIPIAVFAAFVGSSRVSATVPRAAPVVERPGSRVVGAHALSLLRRVPGAPTEPNRAARGRLRRGVGGGGASALTSPPLGRHPRR